MWGAGGASQKKSCFRLYFSILTAGKVVKFILDCECDYTIADTMAKPNNKSKTQRPKKGGPKLDESALTQLTSKIDQSLKSNDHKRKQPPTNGASDQDRKRQRNSGGAPQKDSAKPDRATLLQEIRELGGDEKDLELIEDIDSSDDELVLDTKQPIDRGLKDELAALSKQLGFATYQPPEASEEEEEDEDEGEAGGAELDGGEDSSGEDSLAEGNQDEEDDDDGVEAPKKVGNLVSSSGV